MATDDGDLAHEIHKLMNQGRAGNDNVQRLATVAGTNARMSDMQAALGRSQLRRIDEILAKRMHIANDYTHHLPMQVEAAEVRESWFLYPIELSNRDEVHAKMHSLGIQTRLCADWLLPAHPYYAKKYGYKRGDFPDAERRADRTLLLPLYPTMTLDDVQTVCKALEDCDARS